MSTTQAIKPFRGGSWEQCGAFVQCIRAAAWKEGKIRDPGWTADFASLHLAGEALAWYCDLTPDTQEDWRKLQAALAKRWPFSGDDRSEYAVPAAAAAAPSSKGSEKPGSTERGILKAIISGDKDAYYVQLSSDDTICTLTTDTRKALCCRFDSQSNAKLFECM
ncbi:hypothetical protein FRC01_004264, partial [Tulasnella sp. 417]